MADADVTLVKRIRDYLTGRSSSSQPFFVQVGSGEEYCALLEALSGYATVRASVYCVGDAYPDADLLINDVKALREDALLLGVAESVDLGAPKTVLYRLKDLLPAHRVVVVCRGAGSAMRCMEESDRKFNSRRHAGRAAVPDYTVVRVGEDVPCPDCSEGFKGLLARLEDGASGEVWVRSSLRLPGTLEVSSCYELLKKDGKVGPVTEGALPEECWRSYWENPHLKGFGTRSWQTYLSVLLGEGDEGHSYLSFAVHLAANYSEYRDGFVRAILEVPHDSPEFANLYADRKALLAGEQIGEADMAAFVARARARYGAGAWRYMTDETLAERRCVIASLCEAGKLVPNDELGAVYADLASYLCDYAFRCSSGEVFTAYIAAYKRQKILNRIEPAFLEDVEQRAKDGNRLYNVLPARDAVVERLDKGGTLLYWVDALGVEYLGFMQRCAQEMGMSMQVSVARSSLPTLTCINRGFYDEWKNEKKVTKGFDELKHDGDAVLGPDSGELPVYLAGELALIREILDQARVLLAGGLYKKVVVASDHGASRLAVVHDSENKWTMRERGEHSGRCCLVSEIDERPDCAAEENGYWVLANYNRFRGGRKAKFEVHGGASLEEVLVPIIELGLPVSSISVTCQTGVVQMSFRETPRVSFYSTAPLEQPSLHLEGKAYRACQEGVPGTYVTHLDGISRAGAYCGEVYDGDTLIGSVDFEVVNESATANDEDWFEW